MDDFDKLLSRWRSAGVLDAHAEARIRAFEGAQERAGLAGIRWQGLIALILGAILLACGVALFLSAHWDQFSPSVRFAIALGMVAAVHLAGGLVRNKFGALSIALHAVGTVSAGAAIAIGGQIFNMEGHWPLVILLWAIAAACGWMLLEDQVQQTLTLLIVPAWMICELGFRMGRHIGADAFIGRALFMGAILYLTFFVRSENRVVRGILFAVAAVAAVIGTMMMTAGWISYSSAQTFVPFGVRIWAWIVIATLPLVIAAFRGHKGLVPVALGVVYAIALPWCTRVWTVTESFGAIHRTVNRTEPSVAAHATIMLFALFLSLWGVRIVSRRLVNVSIVYFGAAAAWFYFSNVWDKVGRSLGLIGLGVLLLAGGWMLEKMRRRLMLHMNAPEKLTEVAQ